MALISKYQLTDDFEIQDAYHVVESVSLVKTIKKVSSTEEPSEYIASIFIHVFPSKSSRDNGTKPIAFINGAMMEYQEILELKFKCDISSEQSVLTQAYNHLKSTEYYKDAVEG